jgi:hypothetical protein
MKRSFTVISLVAILIARSSTAPPPEAAKTPKREQDLVITLGGFVKDPTILLAARSLRIDFAPTALAP